MTQQLTSSPTPSNYLQTKVNSDFNKDILKPMSFSIVYNTAETLLQNPGVIHKIQGYTGSDKNNKKLSLELVKTVKQFLVYK